MLTDEIIAPNGKHLLKQKCGILDSHYYLSLSCGRGSVAPSRYFPSSPHPAGLSRF